MHSKVIDHTPHDLLTSKLRIAASQVVKIVLDIKTTIEPWKRFQSQEFFLSTLLLNRFINNFFCKDGFFSILRLQKMDCVRLIR